MEAKTLTVRLHHLTQAAHDEAARHLCEELNATKTIFPGTELPWFIKSAQITSPEIRRSDPAPQQPEAGPGGLRSHADESSRNPERHRGAAG